MTVKRFVRDERGFTLIELVVAMALGTFISLAGLGFLKFATSDVLRIDERVHVDQTGRVALERLILRLHSGCVVSSVAPIRAGSNESEIKFISAAGAEATLGKVQLHEVIFTKPSGTKKARSSKRSTNRPNRTRSTNSRNQANTHSTPRRSQP